MYLLRKIFNPEIFQGKYKRRNYFEGWYFKVIDSSTEHSFALIPGVSVGKCGNDPHAFIQVLDACKSKVNYLRYDISGFSFSENRFEIEIDGNYFTDSEIRLNAFGEDICISGSLRFDNIVPYPKTLSRPSIMGPFAFIPFMECYHGIVNIHHEISGEMNISGKTVDFSGGYGYIEKDWGRSFPEAWIWLQSNHFNSGGVSLMFSLAKIPWLGRYFTGFISFIMLDGRLYLFATYTKAVLSRLKYSDNHLDILLEDRNFKMEIEAEHSAGGILKAPKNGLMNREVLESINAVVRVRLYNKSGGKIFEGEGTHTGLEIISDIFKHFNDPQI